MSTTCTKTGFFDALANRWDSKQNLPVLHERLVHGLHHIGVKALEHVVDVGCGTGNLTYALLSVLDASGRITAVDISAAMVAQAQAKIDDPRVSWHITDALHLPCEDASVDRVICFQVWPHFDDPAAVAQECVRALKPGGQLHIWHLDSREKINHVHAHAGNQAVAGDLLAPADETAKLLVTVGLVANEVLESDQHYLVSAYKP
ncbi:MAG: class I SAM-dependent methyltransferase [Brachymonas sp.]